MEGKSNWLPEAGHRTRCHFFKEKSSVFSNEIKLFHQNPTYSPITLLLLLPDTLAAEDLS
jgi:hypothetical protein